MPLHFSFKSAGIIALCCALIAGCANQPLTTETYTAANTAHPSTSPEALLSEARTATPGRRAELHLQAAQAYWDSGLLGLAVAAYEDVDISQLNPIRSSHWLELGLILGVTFEDTTLIEYVLSKTGIDLMMQQAPIDQQKSLALLMRDALLLQSKHIEAAIFLAEYRGIFSEDEQAKLTNLIWAAFSRAEAAKLSRHSYEGTNTDASLWLQLATNLRLKQSSLEQQYEYLKEWQDLHPEHSANLYPPLELRLLSQLPEISPTSVTLALPFSGPLANVAEAIRDGFLASYYQQKSAHNLKITMFDTQLKNIEALYTDHPDQQLIVGPLNKTDLEALATLDALPTPTLALNRISPLTTPINGLFQFSLSSEAEAEQVATYLAKNKLFRVGVIAPDNEFGYRISQHFSNALLDAGGRTIATRHYQNQSSLSSAVAQLLATDKSQHRARKLRSITALPLESEPRRRQDIDAIFMLAKPEIARQLKPLFAFHYASKLPIFATSQVHELDSQHNDDLEGVKFVEMPWMLSNSHPIKSELLTHNPNTARQYGRFHALGADAHTIASRLTLMQQLTNSKVRGQSGLLSLGDDGIIQRELEWATFKNGDAIPIQE